MNTDKSKVPLERSLLEKTTDSTRRKFLSAADGATFAVASTELLSGCACCDASADVAHSQTERNIGSQKKGPASGAFFNRLY